MDLLEYQVKELFRQADIPVLPSQRISHPIAVEPLAEPQCKLEQEFYLAVGLDSTACRPILLGSQYGGIETETKLEHLQQVIVDQDFSPFYARRLVLKMGLKGVLIQPVSAIIAKMYGLFIQQDLDFVEVNSLVVSASGELMVLDGKITVNDAAIARHGNLAAMLARTGSSRSNSSKSNLSTQVEKGNIGVLCNGTGLLMTTLDLIVAENGKPARFMDLSSEHYTDCPDELLIERLDQGLDLMIQNKSVKVILVNILSGTLSCCRVAEVIIGKLKQLPASNQNPAIVVRVIGAELRQAQTQLVSFGVPVAEELDQAIAQSVLYAESRAIWQAQREEVRP